MTSQETLNLARQAAEMERANNTVEAQHIWLEMADQLLMEGVERHQISRTIIKLVEAELNINKKPDEPKIRWQSSWFWQVMGSHDFVRKREDSSSGTGVLELGNNADLSSRMTKISELADRLAKRVTEIPDLSKSFPPADLKDWFAQMDKIIDNAADAFDDRKKITEDVQHILLNAMAVEISLSKAAAKTMEARVKFLQRTGKWLTQKQAGKLMRRGPELTLPILHPHDRDVAIHLGYYGSQCGQCNGWRVRIEHESNHTVKCIDCNHVMPAQTLPHCRHCGHMLDDIKSKCPECDT